MFSEQLILTDRIITIGPNKNDPFCITRVQEIGPDFVVLHLSLLQRARMLRTGESTKINLDGDTLVIEVGEIEPAQSAVITFRGVANKLSIRKLQSK